MENLTQYLGFIGKYDTILNMNGREILSTHSEIIVTYKVFSKDFKVIL